MKNYKNMGQHLVLCLGIAAVLLLQATNSLAQLPPEVARYGYADTIFINGKVVSMDDKSSSTRVGNIYQAIAVKGHGDRQTWNQRGGPGSGGDPTPRSSICRGVP